MELAGGHRQGFVLYAHDDAVVGLGGHAQRRREGRAAGVEGVVAADREAVVEAAEDRVADDTDRRRLAVHRTSSTSRLPPKYSTIACSPRHTPNTGMLRSTSRPNVSAAS